MKSVTVLALLLNVGCGAEREVDPELQVLLDHYLKFAPNEGKLESVTEIKYGDVLDDGERGVCDIEKSQIAGKTYEEKRVITVDPREDNGRPVTITVYHELAHCLHDMPHSTGPHDIMNPARYNGSEYWTPENIDGALVALFAGVSF